MNETELMRQLYEALDALYTEQQWPPLEKYQDQWQTAMQLARAALKAADRYFAQEESG